MYRLPIAIFCTVLSIWNVAKAELGKDATQEQVDTALAQIGISWEGVGWKRHTVDFEPTSCTLYSFAPAAQDGKSHAFLMISSEVIDKAHAEWTLRQHVEAAFAELRAFVIKAEKVASIGDEAGVLIVADNSNAAAGAMTASARIYATKMKGRLITFHLMQVQQDDAELVAKFDAAVGRVAFREPPATQPVRP